MEENKIIPFRKLLLIGGSAGSLDVLIKVLPRLRAAISFAIVIVLHRKNAEDTLLEELITIKTPVPVHELDDKAELDEGYIYIAPADYHLLFEKNNTLSLDASEKINYSRPSIDVAFESAADAYGPYVTAILLSGANSDGTEGLKAIKNNGGTIVVQSPESANVPFMCENAIAHANPDYVLDIEKIFNFINNL